LLSSETANRRIKPRKANASEEYLYSLLVELKKRNGSDLHLKVGQPPIFRIFGRLIRSGFPPLTSEQIKKMVLRIISDEQKKFLLKSRELDTSYSLSGVARFRVNIFFQSGKLGAVLRIIPFNIQSLEALGLPDICQTFCNLNRGLVLVTGPTGSGKSTTLAAMIDDINSHKKKHIITIEDPIEFLHSDKLSAIEQRELGTDTHSFSEALKHVMRQNPDVILVGELRDLETIALAMTAAETGYLVFATLHTTDAAQTIDRMVDVFPAEEQPQIRMQLANSLRGVISQTLLPKISGGRTAAFEILVCHSGIRNLIREGKTHQIYNLIQTGAKMGMKLLDSSLKNLVEEGIVDFDDAIAKSTNPNDFERLVKRPEARVNR